MWPAAEIRDLRACNKELWDGNREASMAGHRPIGHANRFEEKIPLDFPINCFTTSTKSIVRGSVKSIENARRLCS